MNQGGSVYLMVDVPDFSKAPVALTGLVVGYADAKRPAVSMTSVERAVLPFEPVLERVFTERDVLRICYGVWRPSLGNAAVTGIEILDDRGTVMRSVHREVPPMTPGLVDVPMPLNDLRPGAYRLRVAAVAGSTEVTREIGFLVK